jgi:hypothetical protein
VQTRKDLHAVRSLKRGVDALDRATRLVDVSLLLSEGADERQRAVRLDIRSGALRRARRQERRQVELRKV